MRTVGYANYPVQSPIHVCGTSFNSLAVLCTELTNKGLVICLLSFLFILFSFWTIFMVFIPVYFLLLCFLSYVFSFVFSVGPFWHLGTSKSELHTISFSNDQYIAVDFFIFTQLQEPTTLKYFFQSNSYYLVSRTTKKDMNYHI